MRIEPFKEVIVEWDDYTIYRMQREERQKRIDNIVSVILFALIVFSFFLVSLAHSAESGNGKEKPVSVSAYPSVQLWRKDVQIRVTLYVLPDERNRAVALVWAFESGAGGSSFWEVDERSPRQFIRYVKYASPGEVSILVVLYRIEDGKEKQIRVETSALVK